MIVSYNWLNKYFDNKLPKPSKVADVLTFHSWEIDGVEEKNNDVVFDIKILPDKSMWALSHRGIANDLSTLLDLPLKEDPLAKSVLIAETNKDLPINIESDNCQRFAAAHIKNVEVKPSPKWLQEALEAIGQRSINNIVDASNYVMFDLGQPSHAFDAKAVGEGGFKVRQAKNGESLIGLDEVTYAFDDSDTLITRNDNDEILSIAGLKGGQHSGINENTTDIIVEVGSWDAVAIRKTGQRLKLRTDASSRYENGVVPELVPYGLQAVIDLIIKVAGGEVTKINEIVKERTPQQTAEVTLEKLNSVLGVSLSTEQVEHILNRFNWEFKTEDNKFIVNPPFERTDLVIAEDLIEEIGRVYGYEHIEAITPTKQPLTGVNKRFYYSELIRDSLLNIGFSEVYTSSFRDKDQVKLANALASDKGYLRSSIKENIKDALIKNAYNADLFGVKQIKIFEIGTIFTPESEKYVLTFGVQSQSGYKAKLDDPVLVMALKALSETLDIEIQADCSDGIVEINLEEFLTQLPEVGAYNEYLPPVTTPTYKSFSNYPFISRDIAIWVPNELTPESVKIVLEKEAGDLCVNISLFDTFTKESQTSYAFRMVFQANDRTLTDTEINEIMEKIYSVVKSKNWQVR